MQLLECVPNVSEGRDQSTINTLTTSISDVEGVTLLNVDSGYAANRTVFTFAGDPEAILKAAFALYRKSTQLIDMSKHHGTHPRQGVVDVCPLIPLEGMTMNDAIDIGSRLAFLVESELNIPGYFYGFNAAWPDRTDLSTLRAGQYESLPEKFKKLAPDFGDSQNWSKSGITTIGARNLLVAYNINLSTKDLSVAKRIAGIIRESGYINPETNTRTSGQLESVKAIGWYIKDFDKVQVSCNLTMLNKAGMLDVFLAIQKEAEKLNISVTGSELIGLAPISEFQKAAKYFDAHATDPIRAAIKGLGLSDISPFDPSKKVIESLLA